MSVGRDVRLRKAAFGGALLVAAPLSLASWLLVPASMVDGEAFVGEVGSIGRGIVDASLITGALFFPVAVIAVLGLMHVLEAERSAFVTVGGGLAIFGLTLNTAAFGTAGALAEAALSGLSLEQSAGLVEATMSGTTGMLILFGPLLAAVGTTMLGVRLFTSRTVPRWAAAMLAVYGPLQMLGFASEIVPVVIMSYAVMTLALVPIGALFFLKTTDEQARSGLDESPRRTAATAV